MLRVTRYIKSVAKFLMIPFIGRLENKKRTFYFQGKKYYYFYNRHNYTFINERAIEIPIFSNIINKHQTSKILEVGSTLWNYFHQQYDVVDKYDESPEIIRKDILRYHPKTKYDLIISISTLEHVGWDESLYGKSCKNNKNYFLKTLKHLQSLLTDQGSIIFSVPLGYNPYVDLYITKMHDYFDDLYFMQRSPIINRWKQINRTKLRNFKHNYLLGYSNAIAIGVINKNNLLKKFF